MSQNSEQPKVPLYTSKVTPNDKDNKRKAFSLSDSDEEDDTAPSAARRKTDPSRPHYQVILVDTPKVKGFVFYVVGYADAYIGKIMYERNKEKSYKKFLNFQEIAVWRSFEVLEQGSGTEVRKNYKNWPYRGVAVICPQGQEFSKQWVNDWINNTWAPAFKTLFDGQLRDDAWPTLDEDAYETVNHWVDVISPSDFNFVYNHYQQLYLVKERMGQWLKSSADNLYSVYVPGCVPKKIWKSYNIPRNILDPLDVQAFYPNNNNNA